MAWCKKINGEEIDESDSSIQYFSNEEWEKYPFAGEEKLKWFRDAKLGLFLHVGISAVGKVDISWTRKNHKFPDPGIGCVPDETYDGWAERLKMESFDAYEWIDIAKKGGFKYVVIITKHHDGFHMWDTAYSDYKVTNSPMGRDYVKELVDACNKINMPIGLYYSQRDWHHPDYEPIDQKTAYRIGVPPYYKLKKGRKLKSGGSHKNYIQFMSNSVLELMEKYGKIDVLWWDSWYCKGMYTAEMWDSYNLELKIRERQPHIIINNRAGLVGDFDTPECRIGYVQRDRAWETCMPMSEDWAYTEKGVKPFSTIIQQLIYSVCGDGNYLLSIGCMSNGKLPPNETQLILELGDFMKRYGNTIYNTRSGPWNPSGFGGSVYRDNFVYVHIVKRSKTREVIFPLLDYKVKSVECITEDDVDIALDSDTLRVKIPNKEFIDIILLVEMLNAVQVTVKGIDVIEK